MTPDAYLTDLALTPAGDLQVLQGGGLGPVTGPENCLQALRARVATLPGELPLHPTYGSYLVEQLVGAHTRDEQLVLAAANVELRQILRADRRFLAARQITARFDGPRVRVGCDLVLSGGDALALSDITDPATDPAVTTIAAVQADLTDTEALAAGAGLEDDELADVLPTFEGLLAPEEQD